MQEGQKKSPRGGGFSFARAEENLQAHVFLGLGKLFFHLLSSLIEQRVRFLGKLLEFAQEFNLSLGELCGGDDLHVHKQASLLRAANIGKAFVCDAQDCPALNPLGNFKGQFAIESWARRPCSVRRGR